MALANFFSKNALAAHQILNGIEPDTLSSILDTFTVGIAFDSSVARSRNARLTVSLAVNMAARLFPRLAIAHVSSDDEPARLFKAELEQLARGINHDIELASDLVGASPVIVVGDETPKGDCGPVYYAGSAGWWSRFSPDGPVRTEDSPNPMGACAAACFALANSFRHVFRQNLPAGGEDGAFSLSLFNYERANPYSTDLLSSQPDVDLTQIDVGDTILAGVGAIGSAALFALAEVPRLCGRITLVDYKAIGLTNLQRYILTTQEHLNTTFHKVEVGAEHLRDRTAARGETGLVVVPERMRWSQYLAKRDDWQIERVAMAFDSIADRLSVQPSLPRKIFNAWTQLGDLAVSRHTVFGLTPCVGCLYLPRSGGKSEAEQVGDALGFPGAPGFVRELLYSGVPIGEPLIRVIAQNRHITAPEKIERLVEFKDRSLREFYNEAFCGGVILLLGGSAPETMLRAEAPMAFQSVLAGVMLASEMVIDAAELRSTEAARNRATRTLIDLTRPLAQYLEPGVGRRVDGLCFCDDRVYVNRYSAKYAAAASQA